MDTALDSAAKERLISADSHVHFTDEWVKERLPERLRPRWDEAIRKSSEWEARELRRGQPQLQLEDFVDPEASRDPGHFEPHAKLRAMDRDGVEAEVIFPELGAAKVATPAMLGDDWKEVISGYNDGMADFASINTRRLLTAYQIPLWDIDFAVKEVERLARRDARCVQIPSFPSDLGLPDYHDSRYDRLWGCIQEKQLTILNHLEVTKPLWNVFLRDPTPQRGIFTGMPAFALSDTLAFWILTGTLERFPNLKVILVEPGLGWLPFFFEVVLDGRMHQHYEFPNVKLLPSEYFKRQMGATFMYEPTGLKTAYEYFGPDCIYWSTDFPHPATCWPNSQKQVKDQFAKAGIPEAAKAKIVRENGMRTFGLGL